MGVISSCLSHLLLFFKSKKIKENDIPLIEITSGPDKNSHHESNALKTQFLEDNPNLNEKRFSLNIRNETIIENNNQFFTPRQSLKSKNVRFSIVIEDGKSNYSLENNMNMDGSSIRMKEKLKNKSIASNKSLDFFSCKESDSKRESLYQENNKFEPSNQLVFNFSCSKNYSQYKKFRDNLNKENLEILEISNTLSNELALQSSMFYKIFLGDISDDAPNNSFFLIHKDQSLDCEFYLGSELSFEKSRTLIIKGEFSLNCNSEEFLFYINNEKVEKDLFNFDTRMILAQVFDNSFVYFTNIQTLFGNIGCNFLLYKVFFHDQEDLCMINFSLSNEEIIETIKNDKNLKQYKNFETGNMSSGLIIKTKEKRNSDRKAGIRVIMQYKINYKQNLAISVAKFMFSDQIRHFLEKIRDFTD